MAARLIDIAILLEPFCRSAGRCIDRKDDM